MTYRTSEQIKAEFVAQMGEGLGTQYSELRQELIRIYWKWSEFTELFAKDKKNVELLNLSAPLVFRAMQDSLWEASILHLARLTDPPTTAGKSNLTIQNLPTLISDETLKNEVANLVSVVTAKCEFVRDWRNKIFAHNDLDIALKNPATQTPSAEIAQVNVALKSIADLLNAIEVRFSKSETAFDFIDIGAPHLLTALEDSRKARDEWSKQVQQKIESLDVATEGSKKKTDSAERPKLKARRPRGLEDRGPAEIAATRRMTEAIRAVYERYGFDPVETPAIEYTDALGKFLPDLDRPNEGVFSFKEDDEQWLSLRYDLTAPLARYVAENFQNVALPYRSYRFGWVFRNEKPGPGRFRQFMQFDADTVGSASMAADAEICMMAADTMEALGIQRGQYIVKVNNRKVLDGVMEAIDLGGESNAGRRLIVLRAIDKLDRLGAGEVARLLGPGRLDESGDITLGANLSDEQIGVVLTYIEGGDQTVVQFEDRERIKDRPLVSITVTEPTEHIFSDYDNEARVERLRRALPNNSLFLSGLDELSTIASLCRASGYLKDRIAIDPSVVRGLEYYTGPVYEVELPVISDEKGRPVRFGSVGGGGRYDGLVSRFRGEPVPATGFSIGVSRLQAALTMLGKLDTKPAPGPVLVTVFDRDRVADYQKMVAQLRNAGIRAELYLGNVKHSVGQQLKYADRRGSPCAVIQGGDEKAKGEVQIKDLIAGGGLTDIKDRDEYLKKQTEAQFAVAEDKLVEAVRQVLTRHGVAWD